jgi:protein O-mannosyl-transferase
MWAIGRVISSPENRLGSPRADASNQARAFFFALILFFITVAIYHQVRHFDFIEDYDDGPYITQNFHIKYGLDWPTVKWAFTSYYAGNWDPLTWISHAVDCQLYYLDAGRHHETNVLIHALSAVALFLLLWRATGFMGRSYAVAWLFALHPMNVESVAWIAERKNVLSMLFFLLALGAYRWYARRPAIGRYAVVALLYACSLMSKAQIITFPFLLLLWDYWPLRRMFANDGEPYPGTRLTESIAPRSLRWLIVEKIPLLILTAAAAVVTVKANAAMGAMSGARNSYPLALRIQNAIVSYPRYIAKAFWPTHLALIYPYPKVSLGAMRVAGALLFLLVVTVAAFLARHRARYFLVGWLWFLGALVPMIGIVQVGSHPMADRFSYLPFIGLFIMICWGIADLFTAPIASSDELQPPMRSGAIAGLSLVTVLVLAALGTVTYRQLGYWKDSRTLWLHAVKVTSANDDAEDKLGSALEARGLEDAAAPHFRAAVAINPDDPLINSHAGFVEQKQGNPRQAISYYQKALDLTQDDPVNNAALRADALKNMGIAYRDLGDSQRSAECFAEAEQIQQQYRK